MGRIQDNFIKLRCQQCKTVGYFTRKNKKKFKDKMELKKFCKQCRKHTLFNEIK